MAIQLFGPIVLTGQVWADLEGELETTKQRSKENLEQAILTEGKKILDTVGYGRT